MKTEEMSREDLTAGLAKKLKIREDGIETLELDTSELRAHYDRVKQSDYWIGGYYASIVMCASMPATVWDVAGAEAGISVLVAGIAAASFCGSKMGEDDSVKRKLTRQVQMDLVNLDGYVVTGLRGRDISESEKDLAEITDVYDEAIAACEIDETRLTDMYNTASKAGKVKKWAASAALASLAITAVVAFGVDNTTVAKNIALASMLSFFASAGVYGIQNRKVSRVENEVQDEVTDRLIGLKTQHQTAPKPING